MGEHLFLFLFAFFLLNSFSWWQWMWSEMGSSWVRENVNEMWMQINFWKCSRCFLSLKSIDQQSIQILHKHSKRKTTKFRQTLKCALLRIPNMFFLFICVYIHSWHTIFSFFSFLLLCVYKERWNWIEHESSRIHNKFPSCHVSSTFNSFIIISASNCIAEWTHQSVCIVHRYEMNIEQKSCFRFFCSWMVCKWVDVFLNFFFVFQVKFSG